MKWIKLERTASGALVVVPLHGRGNKNGEGAPVKVLALPPAHAAQRPERRVENGAQLSEELHMTHNFDVPPQPRRNDAWQMLIAGREGIVVCAHGRRNAQGRLAASRGTNLVRNTERAARESRASAESGEVRDGNMSERALIHRHDGADARQSNSSFTRTPSVSDRAGPRSCAC